MAIAERFAADMDDAFRNLVDEIVNRYDRMGGEVVARARELAPVVTGQLRDNIGHEVRREDDRVTLAVHSDAPHGVWQEFGTSTVPARPHIRPALAEVCAKYGEPVPEVRVEFPTAGRRGIIPGRGKAAKSVRLPNRKRFR